MARVTERGRTFRRRRLAAGATVVVVLAAAVAVGLAFDSGPASSPTTRPVPSEPTSTTAPTSVSTPTPAAPPFPVGATSLQLAEPPGTGHGARMLPTTVRFPSTGATGAPDRQAGPFPLVVFSAGYDIDPEAYATLLTAWAAAGYVVADPVYPSTTPAAPEGLDENDIVHHPADLSFVISSLVNAGSGAGARGAAAGPSTGSGPLSGMVDPHAVAVIGHSDGGDVSLAAVANTCCTDHRIDAAVILSGAEWTVFGGTYFSTRQPPLLVVQGTDDDINPLACSVRLYSQASVPKYYLSMEGQTHKSPYLQAGPPLDTVEHVTIDFLDGVLEGSKSGLAAMAGDGNVPGSSTLSTGTAPGLPAGECPGAPPG